MLYNYKEGICCCSKYAFRALIQYNNGDNPLPQNIFMNTLANLSLVDKNVVKSILV